jgi:hypothetical protein
MQTMEKLSSPIEELTGNKEFIIHTAMFLSKLAIMYFGTVAIQHWYLSVFCPGC